MRSYSLAFILLFLPFVSHAQSLQIFITNVTKFMSDFLIPLLMGIAFLFFIVNVLRYFIIESTNEDGREKARALAIYGVAAFVLVVIFWGIVNLFADSIGLSNTAQPCPDYIFKTDPTKCP